jgi:DNA-binding NarL/FixJ family response regulator
MLEQSGARLELRQEPPHFVVTLRGTDVRSSYSAGSFDRSVSTYIVAVEGVNAGAVVHALEREGFTVDAAWGPLTELTDRPGWEQLDLLVVIEPDGDIPDDAEYSRVHRAIPGAAIVVICSAERERPQGLVWAGADAVVFDPGADAVIGPVVRTVLAGYLSVPHSLRAAVQPPPLTRRERQMLELVIEGLTNREIAERLYLAESTVKRHLSSTFRRLGVSSRREAAAAVLAADQVAMPGPLSRHA